MSEKLNVGYMKKMEEIERSLFPQKREKSIEWLVERGELLENATRQADFWYKR